MKTHVEQPIEVGLTIMQDWEILKNIRLQSLLDSPSAFAITYVTAQQYTESEWRSRASSTTQYQYALAFSEGMAVGIIDWTKNALNEFNLIAMWVEPSYRGQGVADELILFMRK